LGTRGRKKVFYRTFSGAERRRISGRALAAWQALARQKEGILRKFPAPEFFFVVKKRSRSEEYWRERWRGGEVMRSPPREMVGLHAFGYMLDVEGRVHVVLLVSFFLLLVLLCSLIFFSGPVLIILNMYLYVNTYLYISICM
jgi:hypothetical protein